jgi:transglutaminase-like putative cysteine protease
MKQFIFLIIFCLLASSVFSQEWIFNSNSVLVDVNISSEIEVRNVQQLKVNLSMYPVSSDFQTVISQLTEPEADDFVFHWQNPSGRLLFRVDSRLRTFEKIRPIYSKVNFPLKNVPADYQNYLQASELIDSDHPDIIDRATRLAAGESDLYVLVHKIGKWIKENVEYDLNPELIFSSQSASWTLSNRRAVCDEMSTLFIALCRAVGVPARFVSGTAYTDDPRFREGWGPHAWAEVYFPGKGWVPFDVTYGQLGDVDLTHIELRKGPDVTSSSAYYSWYGGSIETEKLDIDVSLVSTSGTKPSPITLKASMLKSRTGFGSYNLLEVEASNSNNYYVPATLIIGKSEIIELIGENVNYILLEPNQARKYYWIIRAEDKLDPKYVYTAFLSANTLRTNDTASVEIRKDYQTYSLGQMQEEKDEREKEEEQILSRDIEVKCNYKEVFYVNEEQEISCNVLNQGNVNFPNLNICLGTDCRTFDLKINQQKSLVFSYIPSNSAESDFKIKMTGDVFKTETFAVTVFEKPTVNIQAEKPESVKFNDEFTVKVNISKGESPLLDARLIFYMNEKPVHEQAVGESWIFQMKAAQLDKGINNFRIAVEFSDLEGNRYAEEQEFQIELEKLSLWQSIVYFFLHIFS